MIKFLAPISDSHKYESRRYRSTWVLTTLIFSVFVLFPLLSLILSVFFENISVFILLDPITFSGLLSFLWGSYLVSDWGTKKLGQYINEDTKTESE